MFSVLKEVTIFNLLIYITSVLKKNFIHKAPSSFLFSFPHSVAYIMIYNICWMCLATQTVKLFSHVQLFVTHWTIACQASLFFTISWSSLKLMSIELVMPSNHLILYRPLLLLPSIFPRIKVFSNESAPCIRCPKYWSFSFSISPFNEYPGLISFRIDWLDLLAVQVTLKSLLQHSSKTSILPGSAFFIVQLSHSYMTTGKIIVLIIQNFVGKVMSLLFNRLSRFVVAFLPRSRHLLISWLQPLSTVILETKKVKYVIVSIVSPSICHEVMEPDAMMFGFFWILSFKPTFSLSPFTLIKKLFSSSSLSDIIVVSSAYLKLLLFLPATLIPSGASSSWHFI